MPLWLKLGVSAFVLVWAPIYWVAYGPQNFLWFCDLANFLIAIALWLESPLLFSAQAVSVLVVQLIWVIDVGVAALSGTHPIGGTEYMFDSALPLRLRMLSLFHIAQPPILLWALWRLGYDRRGWLLQAGIAWVVLPLTFALTGPEENINWVWGVFGQPQSALDDRVFFLSVCLGYPLLLYLPSHLLLQRLYPGRTR